MNTNKILVYGERVGDLLDADEQMEALRRHEIHAADVDLVPILAMYRAVARAGAEILLERADSGGPPALVDETRPLGR